MKFEVVVFGWLPCIIGAGVMIDALINAVRIRHRAFIFAEATLFVLTAFVTYLQVSMVFIRGGWPTTLFMIVIGFCMALQLSLRSIGKALHARLTSK